ncbi:phosphoribosyl-ATP pyrophosphohydrolase [uncultured Cohaesibacter sp.]|uniref:phosphoribosyl-ATP pyrophosphohydrolase n=1 Tax=uncultured Cohaesibacter sp. TaxID=1002546 RepID=UPI00292CC524|nr:phosphoribosyl-ATP pyrophosphohydrolase [uncultured Cohaesibacter sp.]
MNNDTANVTLASLSDKIVRVSDIYAERFDIDRDDLWHLAKLAEELGELNAAFLSMSGRGRKRGRSEAEISVAVQSEVADLFAHLLLFAQHLDIDIVRALEKKWFAHFCAKEPNSAICNKENTP